MLKAARISVWWEGFPSVTGWVGRKGKLEGVQFELHDLQGRCLHREVLRQGTGAFVLDLDLAAGM